MSLYWYGQVNRTRIMFLPKCKAQQTHTVHNTCFVRISRFHKYRTQGRKITLQYFIKLNINHEIFKLEIYFIFTHSPTYILINLYHTSCDLEVIPIKHSFKLYMLYVNNLLLLILKSKRI